MNVKMTVTLPLVIVLFVYGVHCTPIEEDEFPTDYQLQSCIFHSPYRRLHPSASVYKFEFNEEEPHHIRLLERQPFSPIATHRFERATVECVAMKDKELTLIMYQKGTLYNITCEFMSLELAQKFYKFMTRDRPSCSERHLKADYLLKSDGTLLAEQLDLYLKDGERDTKIVIKNDEDDPVLIFPGIAVTNRIQHEDDPKKIDLYIGINGGPAVLYQFGFPSPSQATYLISYLG